MCAKEAKGYYQVPNATATVLALLVDWRKGERCKLFDRANRWDMLDAYRVVAEEQAKMGAYAFPDRLWMPRKVAKRAVLAQAYGACPTRQGRSR